MRLEVTRSGREGRGDADGEGVVEVAGELDVDERREGAAAEPRILLRDVLREGGRLSEAPG
eukprot:CAMPEP_0114139806 /NCGR_PEP_ID=MMETSP0043_2-20121206/17050_1 /TAXON_ID=464988 /ORGANISM="Hemiselmis andersenii, Strain CCMP644" /LENGTH=60 /DNA_ID=CAMNT_0001233863 /DNA_START=201 /DNA_END=383 /DNA_ORIENTATION=+